VVSDQPILALSLKTFGLGGAPNAPALNTGVTNDAFQKSAAPAPAAGGSPQQQLQAAYAEAEKARNAYLQLANQLNSAAYQNQISNAASQGGGAGLPAGFQATVADPNNQAQQQLQQMQQQQQLQLQQEAALAQQQQAAEQARQQAEQQLQQQQMQQAQAAAAQQQAQMPADPTQQAQAAAQQQPQTPVDPMQQAQAAAQQQAPVDPAQAQAAADPMQQTAQQQAQPPVDPTQQTPQPGAPQDLSFASTEELNNMISQAPSIQDKVNAMAELSVRGQGNPATYEILKREASADTSAIPAGPQQQQANYARQTALWTLGIMNAMQNASAPTAQLPGLGVISQLVADPKADPSVKVAAIQALQVINRPQDPAIKQILKKAQKDANPDVKARAQSAAAGESIPLPTQQAQGGAPQAPQQPQLTPQA
jgi:chemotaxis protein histidine kinase CheA